MTLYGKCLSSVGSEAGGNVVTSHAVRVEPAFERGTPAVVAEHAPIPDAPDGRHLVIACSSPGTHREVWIRSNRNGKDIENRTRVPRNVETLRRRELVIRVKRRRVANGAALALEDPFAARGN